MRSADWRVSSVPELRSILVTEKLEECSNTERLIEGNVGPGGLTYADRIQLAGTDRAEKLFLRQLGGAEMFWVSADMVSLALDAAGDVPGFTPDDDLPAITGFMILEKPLPPLSSPVFNDNLDYVDVHLPVDAIAWAVVDGAMKIDAFSRGSRVPFGRFWETYFEPIRFYHNDSDVFHDFSDPNLYAGGTELMSFLAAAALLMASPGVADRSTLTPKTKAARKDAKKGRSGNVTVIDLHAPQHVATGDADESGRVYTHRWMVRGHWRNQPHGPNRSKRSIRWIPSYIKGPAGKPLRETERVWAWRR